MKSGGKALFIAGIVPVIAVIIWGRAGFYASSVPVMLLLAGGGIALMVVGARMNRGSEPNKAVAWTPSTTEQVAPLAPLPVIQTSEALSSPFEAVHPVASQLPAEAVPLVPWALVGADGSRYQLAARTVIGRNPNGADLDGTERVIALADAGASVSKAHALVTVQGEEIRVRDLGSTNGTFVVNPQGVESECQQYRDTVMDVGSTLELGEYSLSLVAGTATLETGKGER
ncbi:MAG: hypothetical protein JWP19_674 [Rhodoglobus sp.]|nr:hypothetical protein [Rhodoglobus sp.]